MRCINVHLSADDHKAACDAYRDDCEVEIAGTLDKSQKRWFFTEVTSFKAIPHKCHNPHYTTGAK